MQNRVKLVRHDDGCNDTGGARFVSGPLVWRPDLYFAPVEKRSLERFHEDAQPGNTDQRTQPKEEAKERQKTVSSRHRILLVFVLLLSVACVVMFLLPRARSFTDEQLGLVPITYPGQKKVLANPIDWDPLTYWHHRWSQCETWASGCRNGWSRCVPPNGVYIRNFDRRHGKAVSKELYLSCLNHENRALEIAREVVRKKKDAYASARLCEAYSLSMIAQTMLQAKDVIEFDKQLVVDNALKSYEIHRHILGEGHDTTLDSLIVLGRSLSYQGHMQKAYDCYITALEIAADSFGKPSSQYQHRFWNLMTFLSEDMRLGRKQFGEMYERFDSRPSLNQHEWKVPGELPGMDGYPSVYEKLLEGKYKEADELYHTAVRELASIDGLTSTRLYHCANSYACALEAQGRTQEAQKLRSALNCGQRQKKVESLRTN